MLKTGFCGTEGIFGTRNPLLWYGQAMCTGKDLLMNRMKRRKAASALRSVILRKNGHLYAPVTAAKQSQSAMDYLELPLNSCRQLWAATKPLQTTANRHKIATKPLQIAADCHGLPQTAANSAKLSQAATSYSQTTAEPPGPLPGSRKLCRAYQ